MEESEDFAIGLKNKRCPCPRGKALGGSSVMNGMVYVRGNKNDYDVWLENGNEDWNYDSIMEIFKQLENVDDDPKSNGDLLLTRTTFNDTIRNVITNAYKELGYGKYHQDTPIGVLESYLTTSQGTRAHTGKVFLGKAKDRNNLRVALNAHVTQLLINKETLSVEGVEVKINDNLITVKATKEVILSAGSLNSPQILMNSGVGPEDHLTSLGIELIKDLKVGENFQDHVMPLGIMVNLEYELHSSHKLIDEVYQYFMHRKGALTGSGLLNLLAFVNHQNGSVYPSIQFHHILIPHNDKTTFSQLLSNFDFPDEIIKSLLDSITKTANLLIYPILLHPQSRGKILLRSKNPFDSPLIYSNFFSKNSSDFSVLLEGVKMALKLVQTKAFAKYKPEIAHLDIPKCRDFGRQTDAYWRCSLRNLVATTYHPVGTCKMGPRTDPTAVVDSRLRVHGIKRLRVIDGSIMPTITSGNTNAPIIMIGVKGASFIIDDWLGKHDEL